MYQSVITQLLKGDDLSAEEMSFLFEEVLLGKLEDTKLAALLTALQMKGVTSDELLGLAQTVLKHAKPFPIEPNTLTPTRQHRQSEALAGEEPYTLLDVCGTGGDKSGTFNVSTLAGIVCAAAGARVVKHGNRAATSRCGSFDLLEEAGVFSLEEGSEEAAESLKRNNIAFLFAPHYHPALAVVASVRKALGFPTIFNILGPLVNPARPRRQMIGIARTELAVLMGPVALALGVERVGFVHGEGGLDEVSVTGRTTVTFYQHGEDPEVLTVTPEDMGLGTHDMSELTGGSAQDNLQISERIFSGNATQAQVDFVLANAGVALFIAAAVESVREGVLLARDILESGKAGILWNTLKE